MFRKTKVIALATAALLGVTGASYAATSAPQETEILVQPARMLHLASGVCEQAKLDMIDWAAHSDGYGAYALPVFASSEHVSCDQPAAVLNNGAASGFFNQKAADHEAVTLCEANLPAGAGSCAVVGRSFDA
ncbi:hypothetical protein [Phaeobacter sp. HF9A]|uniref:hypothetical protein n=1 Tax=Phaeobacter sp. HF9A TaxID=2721561 RepID=UPI00142FE690|nr:hypothetical protein [Phaeobacter sp. HF9A]NIZ12368.1 hypothetical protein [Phaeobacter sp. HF9A]